MTGAESVLLFWHGFLVGYALTCAIEVPAYLGAFASLGWVRRERGALSRRSAIGLALGINLITFPPLWAFALRTPGIGALLLAELAVAGVEGALIFAVVRRRGRHPEGWGSRLAWCGMIAVGVNALSLLVGLLALPLLTSGPTLAVG
jgi:hypothetical protein